MTDLNGQITALAPVLNSPTIPTGVTVKSSNAEVPVACMVKRHHGAIYLFAVCMRDAPIIATFTLRGFSGESTVTVLNEQRSLKADRGVFTDSFTPWGVHLYTIEPDTRTTN